MLPAVDASGGIPIRSAFPLFLHILNNADGRLDRAFRVNCGRQGKGPVNNTLGICNTLELDVFTLVINLDRKKVNVQLVVKEQLVCKGLGLEHGCKPVTAVSFHLGRNVMGSHVLELWHGPTCAFKDMALQIMPRLLSRALEITGEKEKAHILVATSGDTGKAALEGYRDVPGIDITVFFPVDGVSRMQKLQITTQLGDNVDVCSVYGNFDDAQNGVKEIFGDDVRMNATFEKDTCPTREESVRTQEILRRAFPNAEFDVLVMANGRESGVRTERWADHVVRQTFSYADTSPKTPEWSVRFDALVPQLTAVRVADYRTEEERRRHGTRMAMNDDNRRKAEYAFLRCTGRIDFFWARLNWRLYRHFRKALIRRGVSL